MARYKFLIMGVLLLLVASWTGVRWWQGPVLPSYTATSMPLLQTVVAAGRVATVSRTQIASEITGVTLQRQVQEGDQVTRGQLLLVLRSDEIAAQVRQAEIALMQLTSSIRPQAAAALANAQLQLTQARRNVARRRDLVKNAVISTEEMEQAQQTEDIAKNNLEAARLQATAVAAGGVEEQVLRERLSMLQAQLAKTEIRSEVAGTVLTRNVEVGDLVQPNRTLFTIALTGSTEIHVALDERNLSRLALQQTATVVADAYPERPFAARVDFIAPSIDPQRGTVEVRLSVEPVPDFLRQDMTVSVNIETDRREKTVVIPNDALSNLQGDRAIVLLLHDGKIQRHSIRLGLRGLAMSEVVAGLNVGDHFLADAASPLPDGARVRSVSQVISTQDQAHGSNSQNELPVKFD